MMTQNMKCMIEFLQKRFDPKTQKLITSTSSMTSRHWPHTMMSTLSIISKVMIQEITHLSVELHSGSDSHFKQKSCDLSWKLWHHD